MTLTLPLAYIVMTAEGLKIGTVQCNPTRKNGSDALRWYWFCTAYWTPQNLTAESETYEDSEIAAAALEGAWSLWKQHADDQMVRSSLVILREKFGD